MEAELTKKLMRTAYPSASITAEILSEGDTIVPDSKPDIGEILLCEGRCFADKTELQKDRIIVNGTSVFTILYKPEGESTVKSISASFPFNHIAVSEGITADDKPMLTLNMVESECTLINSRKLSLKGVISLSLTAYSELSFPVCTDISVPETETKKETVVSSALGSCLRSSFTVTDSVPLKENGEAFGELLLSRVEIKETNLKLVTGKAVIKGSLSVSHLYSDSDGEIEYMSHEIPFTEICDAPDISEDMDSELYLSPGNYTSSKVKDNETMNDVISFSGEICVSLIAFSTIAETVITDAFLPGATSHLTTAPYKKSEIIGKLTDSLTLKESAQLPIDMPPMDKICPVYSYISAEKAEPTNGRILFTGTVTTVITYISGGIIASFKKESDFQKEFDCPSGDFFITSSARVSHTDYNFINQAKADIRLILELCVTLRQNTEDFPSLSSLEITEEATEKSPSIVIYFVKSGDSFWSIAKRYKTTVEKILFANNMDGSEILNSGIRLLIPT